VGTKKIFKSTIGPSCHGLSILRDTNTIPISQFRLEIALFGAIFSSEPIVHDISTLLSTREDKDQNEPLHACKDIHMYSNSCLSLSLFKIISLKTQNQSHDQIFTIHLTIVTQQNRSTNPPSWELTDLVGWCTNAINSMNIIGKPLKPIISLLTSAIYPNFP
jgi:hypothetical protein